MKCEQCGFIVEDGSIFCGSCGNKLNILPDKYINIGYPLGYRLDGTEYQIDTGLQVVELTYDEMTLWCQISELKNITDTQKIIIDKLKKLKCVININDLSKKELLMSLILYRQGFGGVYNGAHCVSLSNVPTNLSEKHLKVWRLSNAKNDIKSIINQLEIDNSTQFFEVLCELIKHTLIYIMYT